MKRTFILVTSCLMAIEVSETTEKPISVENDGVSDDFIILCDTDRWKIYTERSAELVDVIKMLDSRLHIHIEEAVDMVINGGCYGSTAEVFTAMLWQ